MKLGKRSGRISENTQILQKIVIYFLMIAFSVFFISSIIISLILLGSDYDMSIKTPGLTVDASTPERPVLGQFGPISTAILLIGIPLLILVTLIAYVLYISVRGIKDQISFF